MSTYTSTMHEAFFILIAMLLFLETVCQTNVTQPYRS